jgi:Right handed beta helix region
MAKRQRKRHRQRRRMHAHHSWTPKRRMIAGVGITTGAVLGMSGSAHAVDFTVNSLSDSGDGTCDATAGGCTLRDALDDAAANNNAPTPDQILFSASITGSPGTITLNGTQLPTIDEPLYINGPGSATLTVSGNDASRILYVNQAGGVTVEGLTLSNGDAGADGGAIFSYDTPLLITGSVVTQSDANADDSGGGVAAFDGSLSIQASTISGNSVPGADGHGGGVFAQDVDPLSITNSEITGNTTPGFTGRSAGIQAIHPGAVTIEQSTIADNLATGMFGERGAGYLLDPTAVTIRDSTVSGNVSTAGLAGLDIRYAPVTIDNSTFTDNDVTNATYGSGALFDYSPDDPLTVRSSTIAANNGGYSYGGIYWNGSSPATLSNTIVAGNAATSSPDLGGPGDFNAAFSLIGSSVGATLNTTVAGSNIIAQDPLLGPLSPNGGPTMTMEPAPGSPVIDCGSDSISEFDQRAGGFPRVVQQPNRTNSTAAGANGADIGAVEVAATPSITGACANNAPPTPVTPTPPGPGPSATGPTGRRAKALKKCKKKRKGPKRKKCIKKAKRLPV